MIGPTFNHATEQDMKGSVRSVREAASKNTIYMNKKYGASSVTLTPLRRLVHACKPGW